MDFRDFFPLNVMVKVNDVASLVLAIVIYVGIGGVIGIIAGFLGWIIVLGLVLRIVSFVVWLYCLAGITFAALKFAGK